MSKNKDIDVGNIGDFFNNQVLRWNPISFSVEFIYRMRKIKKQLINIPSTRQAVSIPKLLTAIYYRKCNLIPDDFIKAAVVTTPIEDQEIAEKVAFDILFSDSSMKKEKKDKNKKTVKELEGEGEDESEDFMDELLSDVMGSSFELDDLEVNEIIEKTIEDFSNLMEFIDLIYDKAAIGEEPYRSLINILEQRKGYKDILGKGINSLDRLKEYLYQTILREMNSLSPNDIISLTQLKWGADIVKQSSTPWIKATTLFCMNSPDFQSFLEEIMVHEDVGTAAKTARYLNEAGMDPKTTEGLAQQLIDRAEDIMDILEISSVLDDVPEFDQKKIISNSLKRDLGLAFKISRLLDKKFDMNITKDMFKEWSKNNPKPSLSELFQAQTDISEWRKMVDNNVQSQLDDMLNANGRAAYNMANLARELMNLSSESMYDSCKNHLKQNASITGMNSLTKACSIEQFKNVLESMINNQIPLNEPESIRLAKKLGIPESKIIEIFGGNYKLLCSLIKESISDFQRYFKILTNLKSLTNEQMKELTKHALEAGNSQALGALGHFNLNQAFNATEQIGGNSTLSMSESLSAGPGDNLLLQWFEYRHNIPAKAKKFVRELVKDALIKIALNMISNQRGSGEKGLIPTNKLRVFIDGDEMDLIDIDASIENIVMQGKSLNMICAEDLMVMESEKSRVSICFLLDISGSMSGMKLAACSIAVMVLIGSLRAEEVAICFFESDTHVVKEFGDDKDLEDLADELLELQARGGTQVQAALNWGAKQLEETTSEL